MQLDAPAFKPVLTPEVALSIIQKAVKQKHWPHYDISQIKLSYTPFWVFSFDVAAEGSTSPSGKAAVNAYSGELSDFVPLLFDRPLEKIREVDEDAGEVEDTTISKSELPAVAGAKLAGQTGVKKDAITISAVTKAYAPFYRIWVNVADDTFRIDIDACLGAPFGLEAIPQRAKEWQEITSETVDKMKTPSGWAQLAGQAMTIGSSGGKAAGGVWANPTLRMILLLGIVVVLALVALKPGGFGNAIDSSCQVKDVNLLTDPGFLGLSPHTTLNPSCTGCQAANPLTRANANYSIEGFCSYVNRANRDVRVVTSIILTVDGRTQPYRQTLISDPDVSGFVLNKSWVLSWPTTLGDPSVTNYGVVYEHLT